MLDCKSISTSIDENLKKLRDYASYSNLIDFTMYLQLIGSLMYRMNTISDICFAVNALNQFMCRLRQIHWIAATHVLRYLRGTVGYGLRYDSECDFQLQGFTDSDWAGCSTDRMSTSRCCFNLGSAVISWCSRKQNSVALNTVEVEYMAASSATREAVWFPKLLAGLFDQIPEPTVIHCDNQSCVQMLVNPVFHDK